MVTSMVAWLKALVAANGSDLHLKVGSSPRMRVDGGLVALEGPSITPEMAENLLREVVRPDLYEEFQRRNEADFAYSVAGVGRFRVNAFRQRGSVGMVLRRVQAGALSIESLALPPVIGRLAEEPRGLLLVTGPTGSGKTTTLAAMIDHVNATREVHIVTIEDPIEVLHSDKLGMINQREVRVDTVDFASADRWVSCSVASSRARRRSKRWGCPRSQRAWPKSRGAWCWSPGRPVPGRRRPSPP